MEENITVIKTTMGVLAKDQVAWQVNLIKWIFETVSRGKVSIDLNKKSDGSTINQSDLVMKQLFK